MAAHELQVDVRENQGLHIGCGLGGDPGPKLLYGTDWPLADMGMYRRLFDNLGFDDSAMDGILWKTAAELFDIEVDVSQEAG